MENPISWLTGRLMLLPQAEMTGQQIVLFTHCSRLKIQYKKKSEF